MGHRDNSGTDQQTTVCLLAAVTLHYLTDLTNVSIRQDDNGIGELDGIIAELGIYSPRC